MIAMRINIIPRISFLIGSTTFLVLGFFFGFFLLKVFPFDDNPNQL
jgi:hypothetical protein